MTNLELAKKIVELIGGKENVIKVANCMTRLRVNVKDENLIGFSNYGAIKVPSIVCKGNVYGTQFHPEKSGEVGLKILKNFGEVIKWL